MYDSAILESPFVETLAEPCAGFVALESGSPVCGGCGWLDHEHADAPVVREPRRPRVRRPGRPRPMAAAS